MIKDVYMRIIYYLGIISLILIFITLSGCSKNGKVKDVIEDDITIVEDDTSTDENGSTCEAYGTNGDPKYEDKSIVFDGEYDIDSKKKSYTFKNKKYYLKKLIVPYVNFDSYDAFLINNKIKSIYEEAVVAYNYGVNNKTNGVSLSYKYYINDDILSVLITYKIIYSDYTDTRYYTYNFDTKTGAKMDYTQLYEKLGFNKNTFNSKVKTGIKKFMTDKIQKESKSKREYFDIVFSTFLQENYDAYLKSVDNDQVYAYLDKNGKLRVLSNIYILTDNYNSFITIE